MNLSLLVDFVEFSFLLYLFFIYLFTFILTIRESSVSLELLESRFFYFYIYPLSSDHFFPFLFLETFKKQDKDIKSEKCLPVCSDLQVSETEKGN